MSDPGSEPTQVNMPPVPPPTGATGAPVTPPAGQPPVDPTYGGPGGPGDVPPDGPPPEEPSDDKWWWIIGGIIAAIILVIILLLLLGGDDDGEDAGDTTTSSTTSSTSTSTSSTTTSTSTTTTAPQATTTTEAPPVTVQPALCAADGTDSGDPSTPAQTVMAAWIRGDELCAAELMTPAARTSLFSRDGAGAEESFQGCGEGPDEETTDCAFTHPGGATHFLMQFDDGWVVVEVEQTAD